MTGKPPPTTSVPAPELMLFDLDGVLVDSLPTMRSAWEAMSTQLDVRVPFEAYVEQLGRPFQDIVKLLGLEEIEQLRATYEAAADRFSHLAQPFPGVERALRDIVAAGCRVGIVTSKSAARARPMADHVGIPFVVLLTPDRGRGKPSPDTLLLALVEAGTDPANALYVGDVAVDQEAARRAGLRYVHAGWGYGSPTEPWPLVLWEPDQLVGLVRGDLAKDSA